MNDIANRAGLLILLKDFYAQVLIDAVLSPHFDALDLEKHLPRITDFWDTILFDAGSYTGNPMAVHHHLHRQLPFTFEAFERWLYLFHSTVDRHFAGPKANEAKARASGIARTMMARLKIAG